MPAPARTSRGLFDPSPEAVTRGRAFMERRATWRAGTIRHYARHAAVEPHAHMLLGAMFDQAVKLLGDRPLYGLRVAEWNATVRLTTATWRWAVADGTAEGRGLYELWSWRWCCPVHLAATEVHIYIADHAAGAEAA